MYDLKSIRAIFALTSGMVLAFGPVPLQAKESGGLLLLSEGSARAAALGQAYTASSDDIAGLAYNPASLGSLTSGQASFMYQKGLLEDSYGQFVIGAPQGKSSAVGFSVSYDNAGKLDMVDGAGGIRSVNAETDLSLGLGFARKFNGVSLGVTGRVLQSRLIEEVSATAYSADIGLSAPVNSRVRVGAAALNYGTPLKYGRAGDTLPRVLRAGASLLILPGRSRTALLLDAPYLVNEHLLTPSLGLETLVGPMALRAGYRAGGSVQEFTMGAGFSLGRSSLDYSFGLVNEFDAQHKISFALKFGGTRVPVPLVLQPEIKTAVVTVQKAEPTKKAEPAHRRIYIVKGGDTLASIAQREKGDRRLWKSIYEVNKHLISDPTKIEKGMRLIIP